MTEGPSIKVVTIPYGIFNKPNKVRIAITISNWMIQGYDFQSRQDENIGCLATILTGGWARGKTTLTFIKQEENENK